MFNKGQTTFFNDIDTKRNVELLIERKKSYSKNRMCRKLFRSSGIERYEGLTQQAASEKDALFSNLSWAGNENSLLTCAIADDESKTKDYHFRSSPRHYHPTK